MIDHKNIVSIITVCFNAENTIEKTIKSVLAQKYKKIEYIIIDGNSTDNTFEVIKSYSDRFKFENLPFFFISEKDNGIFDAMNKGIKQSHGEWINFMNAGDVFYNDDVLYELFSNDDYIDVACIYGNTVNTFLGKEYLLKGLSVKAISYKIPFCHQSSFFNYSRIVEYKYNASYKVCGDFDLIARMYVAGELFEYKDQIISIYDNYGMSSINLDIAKKERKRILEATGLDRFYRIRRFMMDNVIYNLKKSIVLRKIYTRMMSVMNRVR